MSSTERFAPRSSAPARPHERARSRLAKQRLRDILRSDRDRDRDVRTESAAHHTEPATAPTDRARQRLRGTCEEPIRTRSMARLLAIQGEPGRALAIYEALIAIDDSDATLHAELEEVRRLVASSGSEAH